MMGKKKKYTVKCSKQAEGCIDQLLEKGDKEAFMAVTDTFKRIQEDPAGAGIPIITECDETLLQKVMQYAGKKIGGMGVWEYGEENLFGRGQDFDFELEDILVELFGATIADPERKPISIEVVAKLCKGGLYFASIVFKEHYELKLSHVSGEYLVRAVGISVEPKMESGSKEEKSKS